MASCQLSYGNEVAVTGNVILPTPGSPNIAFMAGEVEGRRQNKPPSVGCQVRLGLRGRTAAIDYPIVKQVAVAAEAVHGIDHETEAALHALIHTGNKRGSNASAGED